MANFRRDFPTYGHVSKSGNDITGDGTPALPYASINGAKDGGFTNILIGTGTYAETVFFPTGSTYRLFADAYVELDGTGLGTLVNGTGPTDRVIIDGDFFIHDYTNIHIFNVRKLDLKNGVFIKDIADFSQAAGFTSRAIWEECTFFNCKLMRGDSIIAGDQPGSLIRKCTFIQCREIFIDATNRVEDNIFIDCDELRFSTPQFINDHNLIRTLTGNLLEMYNDFVDNGGTQLTLSPYATLAAFQADTNTGLSNDNSVDVDPLFGAVAPHDYTLTSASTVINAGRDGQQIGHRFEGRSFDGNTTEFTAGGGAILTNLTLAGNGDLTLTNPLIVGTLESAVIDLGILKNPLGKVLLFGDQDFPLDVIDFNTGDSNPNQITFQLRYSSISAIDVGSQVYKPYIWNKEVSEDGGSLGNGDPLFDITTEATVQARWVQILITIRPDGTGG